MAKKMKNEVKLRTGRSIKTRKIDDRMLLPRKQAAGQYLFTLGQAAIGRFWQKAVPYFKSAGF